MISSSDKVAVVDPQVIDQTLESPADADVQFLSPVSIGHRSSKPDVVDLGRLAVEVELDVVVQIRQFGFADHDRDVMPLVVVRSRLSCSSSRRWA